MRIKTISATSAALAAALSLAPAFAQTASHAPATAAAKASPAPQRAAEPVPAPVPAVRKRPDVRPSDADRAAPARQALMAGVRTWAAQMQDLDVTQTAATPIDLIVTDATSGAKGGRALTQQEVAALKTRPDGKRRIAISYLSIGEAEDYRTDYFDNEYMTEDAPDWLMSENKQWKGNRRIRFCEEGWQKTILGDEDGRNLYNSLEPSPLYKLIELGFDGVYLDRVDVYSEVKGQCPDAARRMVEFVARLAAHARRKNPNFVVILQNAEELLRNPLMVKTIDAVAKEDLFYGADHTERENDAGMIRTTLENLAFARAAGKPVFVLDYLKDPSKRTADRSKIEAQGFIPYFGPRKLDALWLSQAEH